MAPLQASTVLIAVSVRNVARDFLSLADALTAKESFAREHEQQEVATTFSLSLHLDCK
jgi:hypothetical protein